MLSKFAHMIFFLLLFSLAKVKKVERENTSSFALEMKLMFGKKRVCESGKMR